MIAGNVSLSRPNPEMQQEQHDHEPGDNSSSIKQAAETDAVALHVPNATLYAMNAPAAKLLPACDYLISDWILSTEACVNG